MMPVIINRRQTSHSSFLQKSCPLTPLPIFHLYLPSSKPFKCPLCQRPNRDEVTLVRLYVLGHQELYEFIEVIPKIFTMFRFTFKYVCFFLKTFFRGGEDYCCLLTEENISLRWAIIFTEKTTLLASHSLVSEDENDILGWSAICGGLGGTKCDTGNITEKWEAARWGFASELYWGIYCWEN